MQMVYGVPSGGLAPGGTPVTATVTCPAGSVIVNGGFDVVLSDPSDAAALAGATLLADGPTSSTTWQATIVPPQETGQQIARPAQVVAKALCVPVS